MIANRTRMMKPCLRSTVVLATLALFAVSSIMTNNAPKAADAPGPYVLTDLGTLGGLSAEALDINDAGEIVGASMNSAFRSHAYLWRDGLMTDLGTLGGNHSQGVAISDAGHVAGRSQISTTKYHATLWAGGTTTDLTPSSDYAVAYAVNDRGEVVGSIDNWKGFHWQSGGLTMLGDLGGGCSHANDINDTGHIVGASCTPQVNQPHATLWHNGAIIDLGLVPGMEDSGATAINMVGQIVGSSGFMDKDTYEITSKAFLYENGAMSVLPVPSAEAYASDINDSGVVVGTMRAAGGSSNWHAYIYVDGVATNLNSLIPAGSGLHLAFGTAINNAGQIVGTAVDARGQQHAYLLTPVAPGTPVVSVGDALVTEGHTDTRTVNVTVSLSSAAGGPVTVSFDTANGSATADSDYEAATGTVTFDAGETTRTIALVVNGDRIGEANETFLVNLSQAQGGIIGDGQGVVTIANDEPRVAISDVSKNEGNGGTTPFVFTITLSPAPDTDITVNYATANGSATSIDDYNAAAGSLVFTAGQTSKTVSVSVKGDKKREAYETFYVHLSGAEGAALADSQGLGEIRNDDR
jgi:probable HAF family extracellular repeat protein